MGSSGAKLRLLRTEECVESRVVAYCAKIQGSCTNNEENRVYCVLYLARASSRGGVRVRVLTCAACSSAPLLPGFSHFLVPC